MGEEKALASREVYHGRLVSLWVDEVALPSGRHTTREVLRHPGAVAIVPIDADGRVVMVRQYRYAAGKTLLEIPAGTLEPPETPLATAGRELEEETGLRAGALSLIAGFYPSPGVSSEFLWVYLARDLSAGPARTEDDEDIEVVRYALDDAIGMIGSGQIQDGKSVAGLLLAKALLEREGK